MTELFSDPVLTEPMPDQPVSAEHAPESAVVGETAAAPEPTALPQPGILGGLLWTASVPLSQIVFSLPVLVILGLVARGADSATRLIVMLTGTQVGVLLFTLAAAAGCTALAKHRVFVLAPIRILHLIAIVATVLPATMLGRFGYDIGMQAWSAITESLPALKAIDELNTMAQMDNIVRTVPFPLLLFVIAGVPAIAEEIIFRGIIGRGLVARYGVVSGVLITSVLFGLAHGHPAHALSVIPLGIVMHVLYLTTRSIWAPILFHFCNNAFAVVGATILSRQGQTVAMEEPAALPWWVAVAGLCTLSAWFCALAHSRTRLVTSDGNEWDPGYVSTESPRDIETRREYPELPFAPTLAAALGCVVFFASLFAMGAINAGT